METELNEPQVVRFLLDELSEEERTPIEEQLVLDPAYYEAVCAIEDELLRDYLHGKLPPDRAARLTDKYLSTSALRDRLQTASLLVEEATRRRSEDVPVTQPAEDSSAGGFWSLFRVNWRPELALAGAAVLWIASTAWFSVESFRLRQTAGRLEAAATAPLSPVTASFILTPGAVRGSSDAGTTLRLPPAASTLRLTLDVDQRSSDGRYRVLVRTVEGEIVWSGDAAASVTTGSQPLPLTVEFPAALLTPGEYTAVLGSISSNGDFESQATYPFSISAP